MSAFLPINLDLITPKIAADLFSSVRISGFLATLPFFSEMAIPKYFKLILTLFLAYIFTPIIVAGGHQVPSIFSGHGFIAMIQELLIGIAMGLIFKISFEVLNLTGQMVGTAMQLNFAQIYSPMDNQETNILGGFYQVFGMLIFITLHGPIILLTLLYKSFIAMPLCSTVVSINQVKQLLNFSGTMFVFSLLLSLPVMITLFIINIGMAVVSRLSTSFNIFTVGFPIAIFAGLTTLIYSLPPALQNFVEILRHAYQFILHWQVIN